MDRQSLDAKEWKEFLHALDLFNQKYFWECHEVLEDIWMVKDAPLKVFLQGIIQSAAAFYHVLNENPAGVSKLAENARIKLKEFLPEHLKLGIKGLVEGLENFQVQAERIAAGQMAQFALAEIPVLDLPAGSP